MENISIDDKVGKIAASRPESIGVFARRGIDFCCGGEKSLAAACRERGLEPAQVLEEIGSVPQPQAASMKAWERAPISELLDHIVSEYHVPLHRDLMELIGLASRVLLAHGSNDFDRLDALRGTIVELAGELDAHMRKEEEVLFPWIRQGNGRTAGNPIRVMNREHEDAAAMLARIRRLTDDFDPPGYACPATRALWEALERLDADLKEHIHLENNILFPRALAE